MIQKDNSVCNANINLAIIPNRVPNLTKPNKNSYYKIKIIIIPMQNTINHNANNNTNLTVIRI